MDVMSTCLGRDGFCVRVRTEMSVLGPEMSLVQFDHQKQWKGSCGRLWAFTSSLQMGALTGFRKQVIYQVSWDSTCISLL